MDPDFGPIILSYRFFLLLIYISEKMTAFLDILE